jgi:hypothetical protein
MEDILKRSLINIEIAATGMTVQTLILNKENFKSVKEAKKWASDHNFKSDKVDETNDSYRIRQKDPGEFKEGSLRTIQLKPGVKAVVGKMK